MKQLLTISILACALALSGYGQKVQAQACEIPLMVFIPDQSEELPHAANNFLFTRLTRVATENGLAASDGYGQFVISPEFSVLSKSILPGPPRSFVYELEVTLIIGDFFGQKMFSSTSVTVKGIGENETKAYMDAIKRINPKTREIQAFVADAKKKIIAYYDANYPNIIKKANQLASQKQFEEAMFHLMAVPDCSKGYDSALKAASSVYQMYVDDLCNRYLAKAKMAWAAEQNSYGAGTAGEYLAYIYPDAACYSEAMGLYKEIKGKVLDDWKFTMKIYDDAVSLERQRINAWRDVGVAFGQGQKPSTTHILWRR